MASKMNFTWTSCRICGESALGALCAKHDRAWLASKDYAKWLNLPQDDERRQTFLADFIRLTQAEERNGAK